MPRSVAIIGSGPSGFYTAGALLNTDPACQIDVIERLPAPFGLVRYGVAPDHYTTKNVARTFARTAESENVRYFGNIEVGRDVSLDELRELYDAVVLAVGAPYDRHLGIPGEEKRGVIGSAAFVGWYNGHPDFRDLDPGLDIEAVAVIGNGNVAIDVARVLVKTPAEMAASDLCDYAARAIHAAPIEDVYLFGRRGPIEAKFTNVELREMGKLENCAAVVTADQLPEKVEELEDDRDHRLKEKNLATLKEFAACSRSDKPKRVHFEFYAAPVEILGGEKVEGLRLERTRLEGGRAVGTGETFEVACGLVVPAIGYRSRPIDDAPFDARAGIVVNDEGRVAGGLYAVGWIKRGPTGVIGTNRIDGLAAADQIVTDIAEGVKPGRAAFEDLLRARHLRSVSFAEWRKIDAIEVASAPPGAPRRKLVTVAEMLAMLD